MAQGWTQDRVLALAPDPASAKAGQGLAHPKKWVTVGQDDRCAWGECQGSGSKPYQVRFDLGDGGSKCSCPSRKFPCKHALGLMLIVCSSPTAVAAAGAPPWVAEWIAGRAEREQKKAAKAEAPPKPVDEAAQAKRREQRLSRIGDGLAAVRVWAEDLLRGGIAAVPTKGYAFFDEPARRMVDAQAPGLARRIRGLGEVAASGAGWQRPFLEQLASVHLLARAYEQIDALPAATRDDVLATLGVPSKPEDPGAPPPIEDLWQIVAQEQGVEDRLRVQRTWLFGTRSRRAALVLDFAHGTAPFATTLPPGMALDAEVAFFPGTGPRAVVKGRGELQRLESFDGFASLTTFCDAAGQAVATQPWLEEFAAPLQRVVPVKTDGGWAVVDAEQKSLPAVLSESSGWLALAMSGGHPVDLAAAYDGRRLRPLAILSNGDYAALTAPVTEAVEV